MLAEYQKLNAPEYLDGRYFEKVMKSVDHFALAPMPLVIRFFGKKIYTNANVFADLFMQTAPTMYARVIVEEIEDNTVVTRHSQLLIIKAKEIIYFEPNFDNNTFYTDTKLIVSEIFPDHDLSEHFLTSQPYTKSFGETPNIIGGYCVAYVLKFAYFYAKNKKMNKEIVWNLDDIRLFSRTVELLYGPLTEGSPDIEFGISNNTLIGGLGGAGLGYAVGGPTGALLGGAGGAFIGSSFDKKQQ